MRCDLCGAASPEWLIPDLNLTQRPFDFEPRNSWSICTDCHLLAGECDAEAIMRRAVDQWAEHHPHLYAREDMSELLLAFVETIVVDFLAGRRGAPQRVSSS